MASWNHVRLTANQDLAPADGLAGQTNFIYGYGGVHQWRIQRGARGPWPPPKWLIKKNLVCKIVDCNVNLQSCMTCTILGVVPPTEILCNGNEGRSKGGSKSM